ncbi:sulfatase-like hydrolase/transferase [Haematomicrobium sanguinis]|uniref:sulfatase-like hydrolase/transferase n=1 Tax=Haematomicrobium sanguinis TaxID=479106 RepID=UPI0009FDD70F|nr:sulfatase-like hydrolase/transferase [Haematomicrobium sanguinis]
MSTSPTTDPAPVTESASPSLSGGPSAVAGPRPNVIVFFTDQQRWDSLGSAGNPSGLTPNLDLMAKSGVSFDAACTTNPVCAPARSALLTGMYPTQTTVITNGLSLPLDIPTLGKLFQDAGYRTGYIGKWHLVEGQGAVVPPEAREGWDFWLASNVLEWTSDEYRTVLYDGDGAPVELPGYRADAMTDAMIRFIAGNAAPGEEDKPFFLFTSFLEPHQQNELDNYPAPEVYQGAFKDAWLPPDLAQLGGNSREHLSGYYGQIKRLDECVGRVRDVLRSLEIRDQTVLAYTSDHGSHFKTRNSEYKRSCHDGSVRVPFLFEGPGFVRGAHLSTPVSTVSLGPTLLEAAGIPVPDHMQGEALRTSVLNPPEDAAVLIQISESEYGRAVRTSRWKYHVVADQQGGPEYREEALYDLYADPYELTNVIGNPGHEEKAAELKATLIDLVREIEGVDVTVTDHPDRAKLKRHQRGADTQVRINKLRGASFGHQVPSS